MGSRGTIHLLMDASSLWTDSALNVRKFGEGALPYALKVTSLELAAQAQSR